MRGLTKEAAAAVADQVARARVAAQGVLAALSGLEGESKRMVCVGSLADRVVARLAHLYSWLYSEDPLPASWPTFGPWEKGQARLLEETPDPLLDPEAAPRMKAVRVPEVPWTGTWPPIPGRVLVVVDVQLGIHGAQDPAYLSQLRRAAHTYPGRVLAVCGDGYLSTPADLLPKGTPVIWKDRNDGGSEVYAWLVGAGLVRPGLVVEVCGMNTNACVRDTATGLGGRLKDEAGLANAVRIVLSLCRDDNGMVGFTQEVAP